MNPEVLQQQQMMQFQQQQMYQMQQQQHQQQQQMRNVRDSLTVYQAATCQYDSLLSLSQLQLSIGPLTSHLLSCCTMLLAVYWSGHS